MYQVKIILVYSQEHDYDDYETSVARSATIKESLTDWETITAEDFTFLNSNWGLLVNRVREAYASNHQYNIYPVLLVKDSIPAQIRIDSTKNWVEELKRSEKEKAEKKRIAAALRKSKSEQQLLEDLLKKYPDKIKKVATDVV